MMDCRIYNAPYGYITLTKDGQIKDVNQAFLEMLAYVHEDLIDQNIESLLSVASKIMFHTLFFLQIQAVGKVDEVYITFRTKTGEDIPVMLLGNKDECGFDKLIQCVVIKMTKRNDYERELRLIKEELVSAYKAKDEALEQEKKLRKLFETTLFSVREGIMVTDASGNVTLMNPMAEHFAGWSQAEAYGKDFDEVFHFINMSTRKKEISPIREILATGLAMESPGNAGIISRDGTEYYIAGSAAGMFNDNGQLNGVVMAFKDITKEYLQEKEIDGFLNVNLDMLCVSDLDANFHRVNKKFEEVLGYKA